jgi:hypothetical protein
MMLGSHMPSSSGVLGSITNTQGSLASDHRSGSIGATGSKKNELNVGSTNKNGTANHSSGRNTSMNQSNSHIKLQPLKEMPL